MPASCHPGCDYVAVYVTLYQLTRCTLLRSRCAILLFNPAICLQTCLTLHVSLRAIHWAVMLLGGLLGHIIVRNSRPLESRVLGGRKHRGRRDGPVCHGALSATEGCICAPISLRGGKVHEAHPSWVPQGEWLCGGEPQLVGRRSI